MPEQKADSEIREATITATVIRADGTREELGIISAYYKNPLKRAAFAAKQKLKERKHGDTRR